MSNQTFGGSPLTLDIYIESIKYANSDLEVQNSLLTDCHHLNNLAERASNTAHKNRRVQNHLLRNKFLN